MNNLLQFLLLLLIISILGYVFSVLAEKRNLRMNSVVIKSRNISTHILNKIELKGFALGRKVLIMGDEVSLLLSDYKKVVGTILGASKATNIIFLLTSKDEVLELDVSQIKLVRVISRYGRLF